MAGQRRAQYVSVPLGPGIYSNTTGRGAKVRQNYMMWDRWRDGTWVRWHKQLAEKQGGWAYQALLAANQTPQVTTGSPILLLHLDGGESLLEAGLLLHMNGANGSSVFVDDSVNGLVVTSSGPTQTTSDFKFGPASGVFGGDLISVPLVNGGPIDIQQDYTIEGWFKITAISGTQILLSTWNPFSNPNFIRMYVDPSGHVTTQMASGDNPGSNVSTVADIAVTTGVWHHFASCRQGDNYFTFLDGQLGTTGQGSGSNTGPLGGIGPTLTLGGDSLSGIQGTYFGGLLDEVRILKGYALYTANFTPPAVPLTAEVTIPLPNFEDSSLYEWPMTSGPGTLANSTQQKFGSGCAQFPTTPTSDGPVVYTPITTGQPLDLSQAAQWTIEGFLWVDAIGAFDQTVLVVGEAVSGSFSQGLELIAGNGTLRFAIKGATAGPGTQPTCSGLTAGAWHHFAMVKQPGGAGDEYQLFLDGIGSGLTAAFSGPYAQWSGFYSLGGYFDSGTGHWVTGSSTGAMGCLFDEVRVTPTALYEMNFTPPVAPDTLGVPNTLGTAHPPNSFAPNTYLGLARGLHDWSSIDGQFWIAIGTNLKLYVVNQSTLYDITPQRKTSNVTNALTTTAGSSIVTVTDADHRASTGDFVTLTGASPVGGLTVDGGFEIVVLDPDTYTIQASAPAASGATGGDSFSIAYDIYTGLPANGELLGYGTGKYGLGTYGTPRLAGQGVFARLRTWSLDNYGQDLIASDSDGEIYIWQRNSGPSSRATLIQNAPQGVQRVIVDAAQRVIIALGCTDVTSNFDAMLIRWCSFNDINDWAPTDLNTAGDYLLTAGSRIITGLKTKGQNLIFTDTTLYRMQFVGEPDIYDFYPAGQVQIVGPNAAVDVDGVAYMMGYDNFYDYSGTLNLLACDVWETVFDPNVPTSLNRAQAEGVITYTYETKTEITWLYPSIGGAFSVEFTGALAPLDVSATLTAPWAGQTGLYDLEFSDQESRPVQLTQGQTSATWALPLTAIAGTSALFIGNDRYVTYNWDDGVFYYGAWNRSCAQGRAPAMMGFPYGVNAGYLYQHEVGTDAIEAAGTFAIGFYMTSLDITVGGAKSEYTMGGSDARFAIGGSDAHLRLLSMLPDFAYFTGQMNLTISTKDRPQDASYVVNGPVEFDATAEQIDIDAHGSQIVIAFDNYTDAGEPSLGCSFRMGIWQGLALPYAKR